MALTPQDFRPNVEKGARWLEEQGAWDWPDKILAAVERAEFDMNQCETCAVGVTIGEQWWDEAGTHGFVDSHGFDIIHEDRPATLAEWSALEQAWIDYAREEQAAR